MATWLYLPGESPRVSASKLSSRCNILSKSTSATKMNMKKNTIKLYQYCFWSHKSTKTARSIVRKFWFDSCRCLWKPGHNVTLLKDYCYFENEVKPRHFLLSLVPVATFCLKSAISVSFKYQPIYWKVEAIDLVKVNWLYKNLLECLCAKNILKQNWIYVFFQ